MEYSGTGLKAAKLLLHQPMDYKLIGWMLSNEALSLAGVKPKKGSSILPGKLPAIIRLADGCPNLVTR